MHSKILISAVENLKYFRLNITKNTVGLDLFTHLKRSRCLTGCDLTPTSPSPR